MTQSAPSLDTFFSGGGGRSVSWKERPIGSKVSGTIEMVHPPQQVTDPVDGKPKYKKDGVTPLMQVRIDLQTDFRNWEMCRTPDDTSEGDDGRRSLYVGGWMTGAVADALRKAGRQGPPEVGARLTVVLTERTPADNPALNPTNKFAAEYVAPAAAATGDFFNGGQPAAAAATPAAAPAAAASTIARPASITEAAWNLMDDSTKQAVAASLGEPPF